MAKAMRLVLMLVLMAAIVTPFGLHSAAAQGKKDKDKVDKKDARFEIYQEKGKNKRYRFRFFDSDGKEIAMSVRGYDKKDDVQKIIDTIKKDVVKAKVTEAKVSEEK
jgi:uncharacterized protein YegP (UPF0339 family)